MNLSLVRQAALKYLGATDTGQSTNSLVLQAANLYNTVDRISLNGAVLDALNQYLTVDRVAMSDAVRDAAIQYLAGDPQNGDPVNAALTKYITVIPGPTNTVAPVISGSLSVGSTLTTTNGTWSGTPTYAYQWKRDGTNISGATNQTYVLVTGDIGASITCVVTATSGGSTSATSNSLGPVIAAPAQMVFTSTGSLTITTQTSISIVAIGAGGVAGGQASGFGDQYVSWSGGGGELRFLNEYSVTAGDVIAVVIGSAGSSTTISKNGTPILRANAGAFGSSTGGTGGLGGTGYSGGVGYTWLSDYGNPVQLGGGASGFYTSNGSDGIFNNQQGGTGATLLGSAGGTTVGSGTRDGGTYGGGSGISTDGFTSAIGTPGPGAARIMWTGSDGLTRAYPSTNVSDRT
jgi:hypothetical protein